MIARLGRQRRLKQRVHHSIIKAQRFTNVEHNFRVRFARGSHDFRQALADEVAGNQKIRGDDDLPCSGSDSFLDGLGKPRFREVEVTDTHPVPIAARSKPRGVRFEGFSGATKQRPVRKQD